MSRVLMVLIRCYQRCISPLMKPHCRFTPSCSQYAFLAIEKHGAFRGVWLAAWRVLRCQPMCRGGYDPVP